MGAESGPEQGQEQERTPVEGAPPVAGSGPAGPEEMRVGHDERSAAQRALDDHFTAGRLDVEEYERRATSAGAAVRAGDLTTLFRDLPEPHPGSAAVAVPGGAAGSGVDVRRVRRHDLAAAAVTTLPVLGIVALVVMVTLVGHGIGLAFLPLLFVLSMAGRRHPGS